jgi:hypothetical protein
METIGRYLMIAAAVIFLAGAAIFFASKFGLPLGRLPGDIRIERDGFSFTFPLTTCILISVVLTVALNIIARLMKK